MRRPVVDVDMAVSLRRAATVDWATRETALAKLRVMVKMLLRCYKLTPDRRGETTEMVQMQPDSLAAGWALA